MNNVKPKAVKVAFGGNPNDTRYTRIPKLEKKTEVENLNNNNKMKTNGSNIISKNSTNSLLSNNQEKLLNKNPSVV